MERAAEPEAAGGAGSAIFKRSGTVVAIERDAEAEASSVAIFKRSDAFVAVERDAERSDSTALFKRNDAVVAVERNAEPEESASAALFKARGVIPLEERKDALL